MKRWIVVIMLAAGLFPPAVAEAQGRPIVRVTPKAGVMTPADWFYIEYSHFGIDPLEWTEAALLEATVVGLAVEVELPGTGLWIRGEALRTVDGRTSMTHALLREVSGFEPPRVERTPRTVASTVTTGTIDLAFPTRFTLGPIQPYVTAGAGATRYGFDTEPFQELRDNVVLPQPGVVPSANVGVGATVSVLGLTADFQVRDALNQYWDRVQHNVMVLGGVTWRIF